MVNIVYLNRSKDAGYSIAKVFKPIINIFKKGYTVSEYTMPCFGANPYKILKNLFFVFKIRNRHSVFHITGDIHYVLLGLIGCKSVLTIHDTVILRNSKNKIDYFFKWLFWFYFPVKIANNVVCISEKTKLEVLKVVKKRNISVIHNAVDDSFIVVPENLDSSQPVILHIGTGWNKNLEKVILSLRGLNCKLRIIGKLNDKQINALNSSSVSYSNSYGLSDDEIVKEYQNCDIVSFPSLFEGFGMPIIEGQATGRVVLTSNIAPLDEVGKDSVHYVNPESIESIRDGFIKLCNDNVYKRNLIRKGNDNVLRFKAENIVFQYNQIYINFIR